MDKFTESRILFCSMDFGSGKSGILLFFGNPAKSPAKFLAGFGGCQCSCIMLFTDNTNAADLSNTVFAVLISVIWRKIFKFHIDVPQILSKTGKQ